MSMLFSPSTQAFYSPKLNYSNLPDDLVEITDEQHLELLNILNVQNKDIVYADGKFSSKERVYVPTWDYIIAKRNRLLRNSDYTQMPDWPGDKVAWATYRQQLRDIPQNFTNPEDVVFPTPPEE